MADITLQVNDISVNLTGSKQKKILDGINFNVGSGQILGIIGEAGSGKSVLAKTLINEINDPLKIESGQILYSGEDILTISDEQLYKIRGSKIGYIGSNPGGSLDPTISVGEQIVEKLCVIDPDLSFKDAKERVIQLLDDVRIPSPEIRFNRFPFQFSGGMMQRVMIVDALITNPTFLIADNITQSLDVTVAAQIIRLIKELSQKFSTSIVFISSSIPMVQKIADKILVLQDGKIVEDSDPQTLVASPKHSYTQSLLAKLPIIWGKNVEVPKPEAAPSLLSIQDVSRTYRVRKTGSISGYDEVKAVRGLSMEIREGENFGIVGESGCGKSTLTRLLAWLETPDSGTIKFQNKDLSTLSSKELVAMRRSFQLLLQDPYNSLPVRQSVGRIIAEPLLIHRAYNDKKHLREKVLKAMEEVGLDHFLENKLTVGLSAGQRQRVNIARALVLDPKLLILDETLSSLDPVEQSKLLELFDKLQKSHSFTYIFISHDLALVRKVCHRVAVMYLGKVVELAENKIIFEQPGHPYTKALLSAVPTLDEHPFKSDDLLLEGEPPSPIVIPVGCSYRSRCPAALEKCALSEPLPVAWSDEGQLSCYAADIK